MKGKKTFPHLFLSSAEAWLWEETYAIKVVRLNPCCTTFYWMSVFTLFWCKIVMSFVWKRSKNRTEMDHRKIFLYFNYPACSFCKTYFISRPWWSSGQRARPQLRRSGWLILRPKISRRSQYICQLLSSTKICLVSLDNYSRKIFHLRIDDSRLLFDFR